MPRSYKYSASFPTWVTLIQSNYVMVAGDKPLSDTSIPKQLFYIRINFTNMENKCNEISTNIKWIIGPWSKVWVFLRYTFICLLCCPISANRLDGPLPFCMSVVVDLVPPRRLVPSTVFPLQEIRISLFCFQHCLFLCFHYLNFDRLIRYLDI